MADVQTGTQSDQPDLLDGEEQPEPCGENMCHCHCGGGHVCGCDCWRCDECGQGSEDCHCDDED